MTVTTATIEPTTSVPTRTSRDLHLSPFVPFCPLIRGPRLRPLPRGRHDRDWRARAYVAVRGVPDLYYLHSGCLAPYKVAHGLRSVEGRIPRGPGDRAVAGAVAA